MKAYPTAPAPKTRLPKSKTMTVFSNLTASLSRVSFSSSDRKISTSSTASKASKSSNQSTTKTVLDGLSKHTSFTSVSDIVPAEHPFANHPGGIHTAQPSAYWSGRFTGLNDRLLSETRLSEASMQKIHDSKQTSRPNRNNPVARPGIPNSNTTAALMTIAASPSPTFTPHISVSNPISTAPKDPLEKYRPIPGQDEDEARALAIFERLRSMCVTKEALESLWRWQQEYARKQRKSSLLPPGGTMSSLNIKMSGVLARFLGHTSHGARKFKSQAP
ncbi:hypothetical protein B0T11DRAFT_270145 [Plectosphaerella cucumerina]|uniref:Uncharacterized protein n=1 Tax=Plectosphaerella cucumerina TaxID=40658 RepID=A0A8K0TN61_9PEZI|nr:hypothetical protein B0T11DRAFT_270145 [Plectosphaerella cucumerina]